MNQFVVKNSKKSRFIFEYGFLILALISTFALLLTFATAVSNLELITKIVSFASIVVAYIVMYATIHTVQKNQFTAVEGKKLQSISGEIFDSHTDEKLLVLEEAGKFFGASLKTSDMFRLVASRVSEIVHFSTCAFFTLDEQNTFNVPFAAGRNSRLIESVKLACDSGIAGRAFVSGNVEPDFDLAFDREAITSGFLDGLGSALAIPLFRGDEVFCVMVLYREDENGFDKKDMILAEAIGERITPLLVGSFSFEKNVSNALTDSITDLPNERAFFLVLENQIAEAQRFREQRSLTVLAIDIKNFTEINENFGHSTGDRVLSYAAEIIETKLRQMDMLCRTSNDEFLVILPTANEIITERVVERIETSFTSKPFKISEKESCLIELSFGFASFDQDGGTADQLLKSALLRKRQSKSKASDKILFFPKQYVN